MPQSYQGVGWSFPVALDDKGGIETAAFEEKIRQSIWIILRTAKGERIMRPDFGCGIHDLVFAESNTTTTGRIAQEVREALIRWETRIEVLDVDVSIDPSQANCMSIEIDYRMRTTNNRFNLVYPFYLQ